MTQPDPPAREGAETGGMSILLAFEEGKEVGKNLTAKQRAVIRAAEEWREAETVLGGMRNRHEYDAAARMVHTVKGRAAALRVAVDALKGVKESEG